MVENIFANCSLQTALHARCCRGRRSVCPARVAEQQSTVPQAVHVPRPPSAAALAIHSSRPAPTASAPSPSTSFHSRFVNQHPNTNTTLPSISSPPLLATALPLSPPPSSPPLPITSTPPSTSPETVASKHSRNSHLRTATRPFGTINTLSSRVPPSSILFELRLHTRQGVSDVSPLPPHHHPLLLCNPSC